MARNFSVATRTSPLALKQVEEILVGLKEYYPDCTFEIVGIETKGDKDKDTPLSQMEGTDFFTGEIDEAMLGGVRSSHPNRRIDFAVHSAKDLPDRLADGLVVVAVTSSIDAHDVLVSKKGVTLDGLPWGSRVGTSSVRRKEQLKKYRRDLQVVNLRGTIEERLEKLYACDLDAILIAAAGLIRLGLADKITQRLPLEIMRPHPLQGSLAVVARQGDEEIVDLLSVLDSRFGLEHYPSIKKRR